MSTAGVIVIAILFAVPAVVVCATKPKKRKDSGCGSCHSDCSSCSAFSSLHEDYKKDQEQK